MLRLKKLVDITHESALCCFRSDGIVGKDRCNRPCQGRLQGERPAGCARARWMPGFGAEYVH